ncbi:MAG: DUF2933 domain-containing protein [Candidatus Saccharibacteria bacterium]|nr:DUF2933 domain-containing protein [Microbacteriaceae bacterium]
MNNSKYPLYAVAILVGGGLALWAGLSPFFLIFLVACPLMMFFMMRGMNGGMQGGHGHSDSDTSDGGKEGSQPTGPADLDGSHERIDRP